MDKPEGPLRNIDANVSETLDKVNQFIDQLKTVGLKVTVIPGWDIIVRLNN